MALEDLKIYVRARMFSLGYTEWPDGFADDNIPNTLLDDRWHMAFGTARTKSMNQQSLDINWPFTIYVYKEASRDPAQLIDQMTLSIDSILKDLLKASNRTTYTGSLKNIYVDSFHIERLGDTNDNGVKGIINLNSLIVVDID